MIRIKDQVLEIDSKIRVLLKKCKPSQINKMVLVTCPFYKSDTSKLISAYKLIHDIAASRVLTRFQLRLDEAIVLGELLLEFGKVDGVVSRVSITNGENPVFFIEIKTGKVKFVQSSIYMYFEGVKTLIAELKTGEVLKIDVETAKVLIEELIRHIDDRQKFRELGKRIPGKDCVYCDADSEFKLCEEQSNNPFKLLSKILENVDTVVEKILVEVAEEVRKVVLNHERQIRES